MREGRREEVMENGSAEESEGWKEGREIKRASERKEERRKVVLVLPSLCHPLRWCVAWTPRGASPCKTLQHTTALLARRKEAERTNAGMKDSHDKHIITLPVNVKIAKGVLRIKLICCSFYH